MTTHRFENKSVLVTGAGGGIGLAIVKLLSTEGATVVAADLSSQHLTDARKAVESNGADFYSIPGDLTNLEYCDQLPELALAAAGSLDVVINNAGVMRRGNALEASDEDWGVSMTINVEAVFRICRSAIKIMRTRGGGSIVNTASCWGLYPGPDHLIYCTSKAAVATMSQCLGRDHAGDGIRVNAVCPNEVNTPMLRTGFERRGFDPDSAIQSLGKTIPLGHVAEPAEVADAILFLASDQSRYITGTTLEVHGGKPVY
jgi:NAD(P)-dependent dehydrogenase (short-subunit alcohol dehydrogenase family)